MFHRLRIVILLPVVALLLAACAGGPGADLGAGSPEDLVVVAGASGRTGQVVLKELKARGIAYRPLTRSRDATLERLGPDAAEDWVEVDVRDPAAVDGAVAGARWLISVIGTREVRGPNSAEFVDYGGVKNLVDAARRHGVRHIVLLTAIGVTDPAHPLNKAANDTLVWRFRGEEYLRASGIPYTIVRPAGLRDEPTGHWGGLRLDQGDDWQKLKGTVVSREDIARLMVEALTNPALRNVTLEAVADKALDPAAWRDRLATLQPDPGP
jgi:uncharacterized protein YbjT (DUF2867 family)